MTEELSIKELQALVQSARDSMGLEPPSPEEPVHDDYPDSFLFDPEPERSPNMIQIDNIGWKYLT